MSRTAGRRTSRHLESTTEDAAVLFSSLLASPALPLPAAVAAATSNGGGVGGGVVDQIEGSRRDTADTDGPASAVVRASSSSSSSADIAATSSRSAEGAGAAAVTAGLDWLAGVFRLGLACEKAIPGETATALACAPKATSEALADFFSAAGTGTGTGATAASAAPPEHSNAGSRRARRRAEAGARWLGCRLMAHGGGGVDDDGRGGRWPWAALRRDCALQVPDR